uniref:Uncharacterized protein n=1 Tax=Anguilla anguilla TaxID=7936 RepID=A0A0E9UMB9_ANGAN
MHAQALIHSACFKANLGCPLSNTAVLAGLIDSDKALPSIYLM